MVWPNLVFAKVGLAKVGHCPFKGERGEEERWNEA